MKHGVAGEVLEAHANIERIPGRVTLSHDDGVFPVSPCVQAIFFNHLEGIDVDMKRVRILRLTERPFLGRVEFGIAIYPPVVKLFPIHKEIARFVGLEHNRHGQSGC